MASSSDNVIALFSRLVTRLSSARDLESASGHLLGALHDVIELTLRTQKLENDVRVLRGTIHYRPDDSYRQLWTREFGPTSSETVAAQQPSLTAWRWVARRRCPVSIDIEARLLRVFEGGSPRLLRDDSVAATLSASATCQRLRARDVNYLHVLPIRRPANLIDGMVSIEMSCSSELGDRLSAAAGETMQLLIDLAAPYLSLLPLAPLATRPTVDEFLPVIGNGLASVVELLRVFAALEETILVMGPTGVGKSRLARYCHAHSSRSDRPFITVDLLACPEDLQMAQLVGWKKGAFTGAEQDTPGAIQRADGGTLFIDEIDKLSLKGQAGLLRLLEDRVYRPVGYTGDDRKADVRFIVGTNADLRAAMQAGRFREDLYYRIAVLTVRVPALSERLDEIPAWADYMLRRCVGADKAVDSRNTAEEIRIEPEAAELLQAQVWPGNLRQLDNVIRRAYAYCLLEFGRNTRPVMVTRAHVERAVLEDSTAEAATGGASVLIRQIRAAARQFAREVKRRAKTSSPLSFEWADAFRGFVLEATLKRFANKEEALAALGLGNVVKDRNHHRMIKRELELVSRFVDLLEGSSREDSALPVNRMDVGTSPDERI